MSLVLPRRRGVLLMAIALAVALCLGAQSARAADTGKISGHIVGPDKQPVPNCPIRVSPPPDDNPETQKHRYTATTDKNGDFVIDNVPVGNYSVFAGTNQLGKSKGIKVEAGKETKVELEIKKAR